MSPDDQLDLSELRTLSAQEVADATGVPIETVWSCAKNGSLYGRKLGREWRFTIPAVKEWVGISGETLAPPKAGGSATPPSKDRPKRGSSSAAKRTG
ncbi:MAG: helix-turn-helix domain-containing protein [Acidimicrobiia bacterium]